MKLSELIDNRDKLRRYDELSDLLGHFKSLDPDKPLTFQREGRDVIKDMSFYPISVCISALESEIAKLEEE